MIAQTPHGEVRFKVQRSALLLGEFTSAQLVRATGLNPESVRTEIQRLKQEGFIVSERRSGQREVMYRLSDDPEKRLALSRSVEAFYPEPSVPVPPRPTSRLYQAAIQTLDQAEKKSGGERQALLEQAAYQLEGAWQAEGASRAPEPVQAHLLREQGRLACLQGKRERARELFQQACEKFAAAGLESETRLIDEYLLYVEARLRIDADDILDPAVQVRCVLEVLKDAEYSPASPLLRFLTRSLSQTLDNRVAAVTITTETHREVVETHREVRGIREEMREELRRLRQELPRPFTIQKRPDEGERPGMPTEFSPEGMELLVDFAKQFRGRKLNA